MRIQADVFLPFERPLVFTTYRDRLGDLIPHLPNIQDIRVISRTDRGDEVDFVNEWVGGGDIPKVVRSVLKESMLRWTDFATWHERDFTVSWRTEVHAFPGAVTSGGRNRYVAVDGGTRLELRGDLTIDAAKVPGVPRLLQKTVAETGEKIIVGSVQTNLVEIARGVEKLLSAQS
ncbi:MAG: hypothetical protein HOW73_02355 [Polyangiaceae bacterium]|nr:hypothetical protein [Polyangiaceae bacterium]